MNAPRRETTGAVRRLADIVLLLAAQVVVITLVLSAASSAADRTEYDAVGAGAPAIGAQERVTRLREDPGLRRLGIVTGFEERLGLPTFVYASASPSERGEAAASLAGMPSDRAARIHLGRLGPLYGLDAADIAAASLRRVHDTGHGGIIASFGMDLDGIEVFRDELKIVMSRDHALSAATGFIPSRSLGARSGRTSFRLTPAAAITRAIEDFTGAPAAAPPRRDRSLPGGYESFIAPSPGLKPVRVKKVWFHLPEELAPAYYMELIDESGGASYVVSAADGALLFRHDLVAYEAFSYRVWADAVSQFIPMDGPQGNGPTPSPSGMPVEFNPPFVVASLITLQNGPISTNDPWLPADASATFGNNVFAYTDAVAPDGFSSGDQIPTPTAPHAFDRTYDPTLDPISSADQQMAAATQLFYTTNFLHDWFYDDGFDEVWGNGQNSNYGRGGLENDALLAEGQDYFANNNANMRTPADGYAPTMQVCLFNRGGGLLYVDASGQRRLQYPAEIAPFGPTTFNVVGQVVVVADSTAPSGDGCEAIGGAVAGKVALIDMGNCSHLIKAQNAQDAGAIGVILVGDVDEWLPPSIFGPSASAITIPVISVPRSAGNTIKDLIESTTVTTTLIRITPLRRDGTIDNQIVAHEWGHFISNRLIGNANGLTTKQSKGLGEGWGDFHSLLMTVRSGDNFGGAYALAGYAYHSQEVLDKYYYFGARRYPYSTDLTKNPLTFRHIQDGVALPVGAPVAEGSEGDFNSEVHNTGEVWASMLWECYAALLRDTGRLTFAQAQARMKSYLVTAYKLTPIKPTFIEARDALLIAAFLDDRTDFSLFCQAFAKRGMGTGAVAPDRYSADNSGIVESFACGGDLRFVAAAFTDEPGACDHDSYIDNGEVGRVGVTLKNVGSTILTGTTVTVSCSNPAVTFPDGETRTTPGSDVFGTTGVTIPMKVSGAVGVQDLILEISFDDPGLLVPGPRLATATVHVNADEAPSGLETAEERLTPWIIGGDPYDPEYWWNVVEAQPNDHRFFVPDARNVSDQQLTSPSIHIASGQSFSFQFTHKFSFETGASFYDGGVIEISTNNGITWSDIGASASPAYGGTISSDWSNPLGGRSAYVGRNASYPATDRVTVSLGSGYGGMDVRLRFRFGADVSGSDFGWEIDSVQVSTSAGTPFVNLVPEPDVCAPAGVADDPLPTILSFSIASENPSRGVVTLRFGLPRADRVEVALYDLAGRRVARAAEGPYPAGYHAVSWTPEPDNRAGVYFARLTSGGRVLVQRVVMLR